MAPSPIILTDGRAVPLHPHAVLTAEDDGRAQPRARRDVLQPSVPQLPGVAAVDFW